MAADTAGTKRRTIGLADIPRVLFAPGRVFARIEDVAAYGWHLVLLLLFVTAIGYATVETGLIDRQVDLVVQKNIEELEKQQVNVVERSALSKMIEEKKKEGDFLRLMARGQAIAAGPAAVLANVLLLSAFFYGVVALSGRKPEWHTLVSILVFASFAEAAGMGLRLAMMMYQRTLEVDTSLAVLTRQWHPEDPQMGQVVLMASGLLSALDPFRIWFWGLVAVGLAKTSQVGRWKAGAICAFLWLAAAAIRGSMLLAAAQAAQKTAM